jgi:hypothetical protein
MTSKLPKLAIAKEVWSLWHVLGSLKAVWMQVMAYPRRLNRDAHLSGSLRWELMAPTAQSRIPARAAGSVPMPAIKCFCRDPLGKEYALSQSGPIRSVTPVRKA